MGVRPQMQEAEEEADSGRSPSGKGPGRRRWLSRWLPKGGGGGSGGHRLTDRLHAGAQRARGSFSGGSGAKGNKGEARQGSAELPERRDSGPPPGGALILVPRMRFSCKWRTAAVA